MIEVNNETDSFGDIMILALRYALGRKTYVTCEVPQFIMNNSEHINERVCTVMIRDINNYIENRNLGYVTDDECDLNSWSGLSNWLFKLARERKYNTIGLRH